MIKSIASLPLLFLIVSYAFGQTNDGEHYFEGKVEYGVTYESLSPYQTTEDLTAKSPNKKIIFYKEGSSRTESYLNDELFSTAWFDVEANKTYIQKAGSDTIYFYDVRKVDFDCEPIQISDGEEIAGYATKRLSVSMIGKKGTPYEDSKGTLTFDFATDLKTNPEWFKNYQEFNFGEMVKMAPGIYLQEIDQIDGIRILTKKAISVSEEEVEFVFSIDPTKTYIEI